jgi:hypothetical protein
MKKFQLTVPFSCTENWNEMAQTNQGRHCGTCQTTVYNFAAMSDLDILNFFSHYAGQKLCGRVSAAQSSKVFKPRKTAARSFLLRAAFIGLSLLGCVSGELRAGNIDPSNFNHSERPISKEEEITTTVIAKLSNGNVVLKNATVQIYKVAKKLTLIKEIKTNDLGHFSTDMPIIFLEKGIYFKIIYNQKLYKTKSYKTQTTLTPIFIDITKDCKKIGRVSINPISKD